MWTEFDPTYCWCFYSDALQLHSIRPVSVRPVAQLLCCSSVHKSAVLHHDRPQPCCWLLQCMPLLNSVLLRWWVQELLPGGFGSTSPHHFSDMHTHILYIHTGDSVYLGIGSMIQCGAGCGWADPIRRKEGRCWLGCGLGSSLAG